MVNSSRIVDVSRLGNNGDIVTAAADAATDVVVTFSAESALPGANGVANDDSLYLHPHWSRYGDVIESVSDAFIYGVGVYITLVCLAGIVGNTAVVSVFIR